MGSIIPFKTFIFPDAERIMVEALSELLLRSGENPNTFRVGTQKLPPQANPQAIKNQIILRSEGSEQLESGLKQEGITIMLYTHEVSSSSEYAEANRLALLLEALLPLTPLTSVVGLADVLQIGMQPVEEDGTEEVREINLSIVLKAQDFLL